MAKSQELFKRAVNRIPGGVNSPVRAYGPIGMAPRFIDRADGCYIYDVEGNEYVDYIDSWGPMILGHNFPVWRRFCGGKGVAVTCAAIVLVSPLWGAVSCLAGLAAVLLSGYLPLGAVLIPCLFIFPAFAVHGVEPGILSAVLAILMVIRHIHGLERIASHTEKKFGPRRT